MTSNQNGIYALHNSSYFLLQAGINRSLDRDTLKKWGYTYGANMVYGLAGSSDFQPNEYWLGLRFHQLILKAGTQSDPILYGGLSSTKRHTCTARVMRGLFPVSRSPQTAISRFCLRKNGSPGGF